MLVVGLEKCLRQRTPYPYPAELQYVMNVLSLYMTNYPKTFPDLLTMFEKPVKDWWCAGDIPDSFDPRLRLVYMGQITEALEDFLIEGELRGIDLKRIMLHVDNLPFRKFYEQMRADYDQTQLDEQIIIEAKYAHIRVFLIQHPFTTPAALRKEFGLQWELLDKFYISVEPDSYVYRSEGIVLNCLVCGALKSSRDGNPTSVKLEVCQNRCLTDWQEIFIEPHLKVVSEGVLRRIVIPGRVELALYIHLQDIQTQFATLNSLRIYPGVDAYDLQLHFEDGEAWAVDVKDYRDPIALGREIEGGPFRYPQNNRLYWDRFYYVIPDERETHYPGYCDKVRREAGLEEAPIHILPFSAFCRAVKKKVWEID
jgi:hypothetical protein